MRYKTKGQAVCFTIVLFLSACPVSLAATTAATSTTTQLRHAASAETSIFAESALMDKETGRIFWEGGSKSTLSESLESRFGSLVYAKAAVVSLVLWGCLYGWVAAWARQKISSLDWIQNLQKNAPIPMAFFKFTLLGGAVPRVPVWLLVLVVLVYVGEAYFCSTQQFLANRSDCQDVETFIEQLREETPQIQWKVRVFQYERLWQSLWQDFRKRIASSSLSTSSSTDVPLLPSMSSSSLSRLVARKRIIHHATGNFEWKNQGSTTTGWQDGTTAGVWTRARGERGPAPLAKIHLTQVMVLDRQARQEYFRQQGQFVKQHAASSDLSAAAEFATHISVPGYKPRVLVTRQGQWWCSRRVFWFCTLLGLSAFYRMWMSRHCDVIRVSLVKETVEPPPPRPWWSTYTSSSKSDRTNNSTATAFRSLMQQLEVYRSHPVLPALSSEPVVVADDSNVTRLVNETTRAAATSSTELAVTGETASAAKEKSEIIDLDEPVVAPSVQDSTRSTNSTQAVRLAPSAQDSVNTTTKSAEAAVQVDPRHQDSTNSTAKSAEAIQGMTSVQDSTQSTKAAEESLAEVDEAVDTEDDRAEEEQKSSSIAIDVEETALLENKKMDGEQKTETTSLLGDREKSALLQSENRSTSVQLKPVLKSTQNSTPKQDFRKP